MIAFLTSSAYDEEENIQTVNSFLDNLKKHWPNKANVLYIASFPDNYEITDEYSSKHFEAYKKAGLSINKFIVLDHRNVNMFNDVFMDTNVIILCGGHCPTEMKFFNELHLKERLKSYDGIIIATSAGSMNSANVVYAQPEEEGETSSDYVKYYEGLGLTNINILPHYQDYKNHILDGKRVFEDITYKDSDNKFFYCFNDGTYLLIEDGFETIYGETYLIHDGFLKKLQNDNDYLRI